MKQKITVNIDKWKEQSPVGDTLTINDIFFEITKFDGSTVEIEVSLKK